MSATPRSRLLLDEMYSPALAAALRSRDVDATAVLENPALVARADELVLEWATDDSRALVTANIRDFAPIAARWRSESRVHHGLVYVAHGTFPRNRGRTGRLVEALAGMVGTGSTPPPGTAAFLRRAE